MKRVVLVTGATGNLGKAVVNRFSTEGDVVIGTVRKNENISVPIETHVIDLSDETLTQKFFQSVLVAHEHIDVAILTVGGFAMGGMNDTSWSDLVKQIDLNFKTTFNIARPVFLQMKKQRYGRIFLIGSKPGLDSRHAKNMLAYSLSKSLIFRFAELMNQEAEGTDVLTSIVVPSIIDTPENRKSMPDADHSKWVKGEEIAELIFRQSMPNPSVKREPILKIYGGV